MDRVWILGGMRSFIGVKDRMYRHIPAEELGAAVLKELMKKFQLNPEEIDFIIGGNAAGGGGNLTRLAALTAGISEKVPAVTLDLQCGSGLESITAAAAKIESGLADLVIAGGMESASTQPVRMWNPNHPDYVEGKTYSAAKFIPGRQADQVMLEGAEQTAISEKIKKEQLNFWVLRSHRLAALAAERGVFSDIQVSAAGSSRDEGIRANISERLLNRLPCLLPGGKVITAGNACLMHDGAAFLVLCSEKYGKIHGLHPEAMFRMGVSVGGDPLFSPRTACFAARKLLQKAGFDLSRIDAFEVNEAFAVIDELFMREFPGIESRYNIFGGALAYGHPYGASGGMILLHLIKALERREGRYGLCAIAAAGGVGSAVLIEKRGKM